MSVLSAVNTICLIHKYYGVTDGTQKLCSKKSKAQIRSENENVN